MTTDDKYSRRNMHNFSQQLEARLSVKEKTFSGFFNTFLKCASISDYFEEKDEYPSLAI